MSRKVSNYSRTQIILHWAIAILILLQFLGGDFITGFFEQITQGTAQQSGAPAVVQAHVILGSLTLALIVLRLALRLWRGVPEAPAEEDARLKLAAKLTHGLLYLSLFLVPITGLVSWFGTSTLAGLAHAALTSVLLAFAGLHIAAALYHHFFLKNNLLARIVPEPVLERVIPQKLREAFSL